MGKIELFDEIEERYVETNGIKLHTIIIGEGEPIIMLHGFPEFWYSWKNVILGLKDEFKLIVPDTRGINLSDKPEGVENYKIKLLVDDIKGLAEAFQLDKFTLVGHDFGGVISWYFAGMYPELLKKLVIVNVAHPLCMQRTFMKYAEQREMMAYAYDLMRWNAAEIVSENDYQRFREGGIFDNKDEFDEKMQLESWAQPGSLKAGCAYYRAVFDPPPRGTGVEEWKDGKITVPTLVIHGMQDHAMLPQILDPLDEYVEDLKIIRAENGSHWMDDKPDLIIREIRRFIKGE